MQVLNYNEVFQNCNEDLSRTHAYIRLQEMQYGEVEVEDEAYIEFDTDGRQGPLERASFPVRLMSRLRNRPRRPEMGRGRQLAKKFRAEVRNAVAVIFSTGSNQPERTDASPEPTTATAGTGAIEVEYPGTGDIMTSTSLSHPKATSGQGMETAKKLSEAIVSQGGKDLVNATISSPSLTDKETKLRALGDTGEGDNKRVKCRLPSEEQAPHIEPGFVARAIKSLKSASLVERETDPKVPREAQVQVPRKEVSEVESNMHVEEPTRQEGGRDEEQAGRAEPSFVSRAIQPPASAGLVQVEEDLLKMEAKLQVPELQVSEIETNMKFIKESAVHESQLAAQSIRSGSPVSLLEEDISDPSALTQHQQPGDSEVSHKNTPPDEFKPGYVARVVESLNYYIDHERGESPPGFRSTGALFSMVSK